MNVEDKVDHGFCCFFSRGSLVKGIKLTNLVNQPTTLSITVLPSVRRRPVTKSEEMSDQGGIGTRSLTGC